MTAVIVDTGPIAALLNSKDAHHAWTTELLTTIAAPLLTCEALVSEACFLVHRLDRAQDAVLALIERGVLKPDFSLNSELSAVRKLTRSARPRRPVTGRSSGRGFSTVDETDKHFFIRIDTISAYVIPKAAFQNAELAREFVDFARRKAERAGSA